jgi:hypothetical protein
MNNLEQPTSARPSARARLLAIAGITVLHLTCYFAVNTINSHRPDTAFVDLTLVVDGWIPYIGWTWVIYYCGDVYITLWAAAVFWQIPSAWFGRAVQVYAGMIVAGAAVQLLVPASAPWPSNLTAVQQWVHDLISMQPYACLPSMHVALTVLPAGFAVSVLRSPTLRVGSVVLAALITVSTLTLKEHFFLDAVAGVALGLAAYSIWRIGTRRYSERSTA